MTLETTNIGRERSREVRSLRLDQPFYRNILKRLLDATLVLMTLPFVLPLVILMATLVVLGGQLPFYRQRRIGKDGKLFWMWKIRTMVNDADVQLERYLNANPRMRPEWDCHQKLRDDPRITPIGQFLRKTSMDELPQLWNVLNGSMSLVGPRPMMPEQQSDYSGDAYFRMRPGLTGLWQISDRHASSFAARARFDEDYDAAVSLRTDVSILARTVGVVLRGTGC